MLVFQNGLDVSKMDRVNMRLHHDNRSLEVQVGLEDDGLFECVAKNKAGRDSVTFELSVIGTYCGMTTQPHSLRTLNSSIDLFG